MPSPVILATAGGRDHARAAERLAGVDVREVHLDDRDVRHGLEAVVEHVARVRERAGVEDDAARDLRGAPG